MLATVASADLPKKPSCSDVTYSMIGAAFGTTPSYTEVGHSSDLFHTTVLECGYCTQRCTQADVNTSHYVVSVEYHHGTEGSARAFYQHQLKEVRSYGSPVRRLSGIGDEAFFGTGIDVLIFRGGGDIVSIKHGVPQGQGDSQAVVQAFETLAKWVAQHA